MRTYLWRVSYSVAGAKGLVGEGGTSRRTSQVAASGAARIHTTVLLTAEQIDEAAKASVAYRGPGA